MTAKTCAFGLGLAVAAGCGAVALRHWLADAPLRAEARMLPAEGRELDQLRMENAELAGCAPGRLKEVRDRLAERESLKRRIAERSEQLREREAARPPAILPRARAFKLQAGMIDPTAMRDVGRATPSQAWQTMMWAILNGDADAQANAYFFGAREESQASSLFAGLTPVEQAYYGTPEKMAASVFSEEGRGAAAAYGAWPMKVVSETPLGSGQVGVATQIQVDANRSRDNPPLLFQLTAGEWKAVVSPEQMASVQATLANQPPSQRALVSGK